MSDARGNVSALIGIGLLAFAAWQLLGGGGSGDDGGDGGDQTLPQSADGGGSVLDAQTVYQLASDMLSQMSIGDIAPSMVVGIASNESSFDPSAVRQEPSKNTASYGLMQVLLTTATWLHDSLGFNAFDATPDTLLTPQGSLYFGCAYLHWLRNWKGQVRPDDFVVAAYNGGPGGASLAGPQRYLASYQSALSSLGFA